MFSQILKLIPRTEFEAIVKMTGAQHAAKGFTGQVSELTEHFFDIGVTKSQR